MNTAARLREQEQRVAAISSPEEFAALITDRGIDLDGLTDALGQRCVNLWAVLSGQGKGWQPRRAVTVPSDVLNHMVTQWIDGFALGVLMEHGEDEPVEPVLGFEDITKVMRDADSLAEEHNLTIRHMGYDVMVVSDRVGARVNPDTRAIFARADVPVFAPGLDGLSMGVCVIRYRRDGYVMAVEPPEAPS